MPESDRYVRIASRTQDENEHLVRLLDEILAAEAPDYHMTKRF
jgi:histidinol-phosphate/aromatic aminotransferase/cobyric acid decarboxylase-like protein